MTKNATLPTIDAGDLTYHDGDSRLVIQSPFRCGSDYSPTPSYTSTLSVQANEYQVECIVRYSPDDAPELARRLRAAADKISAAPKPKVKLPPSIDLCPVTEHADPDLNEYNEGDEQYNSALEDVREALNAQGFDVELVEPIVFTSRSKYLEHTQALFLRQRAAINAAAEVKP